jgi:hypothetical protein
MASQIWPIAFMEHKNMVGCVHPLPLQVLYVRELIINEYEVRAVGIIRSSHVLNIIGVIVEMRLIQYDLDVAEHQLGKRFDRESALGSGGLKQKNDSFRVALFVCRLSELGMGQGIGDGGVYGLALAPGRGPLPDKVYDNLRKQLCGPDGV